MHPQVHFNDTQECQASSQKNPEQTKATSSASSYRRWWCTSRDLHPFARSTLIDLLGITILLCLSPNKLLMAIYLINEMAFPHLTSNNTKYCAHLMYPSNQLSSPVDSSLSHSQRQQLKTVPLFQLSWVYKQANWAKLLSIASAPASTTTPPLQVFTSPLPAAPGCSIPRREDFIPEVLVAPAKRPQVVTSQVYLLCCWGSWRAGRKFTSPPCSCIQHSLASFPCGAASWSCEPELPSGTRIPTRDWTPVWYGFDSSLWRKSLLLRVRSFHLVPLY